MDAYGRSSEIDRSDTGYRPQWFGLEEPTWRLGLGGGNEAYPERPGAPDCAYYMRTGSCGYGSRCRYNHPRDRIAVEAVDRATDEYPERVGEPPCQFYLKTGTCKFGASCKFHHPKDAGGHMSQVPLNIYGYPLRPGERECSYYLQTGQCRFGISCKFHHPQTAGTSMSASAPHFYPQVRSPSVPTPEQYGASSAGSTAARPPLLPGSYIQGPYGPMLLPPAVVPIPGWSAYSAPMSPVLSPGAQHGVGATTLYGVAQLSSSTPSFAGAYPALSSSASPLTGYQIEQRFPERPGEPECRYYLRTGGCKFGPSCKFHHPRDRLLSTTDCVLSPIGLPLRPGVQPCAFYMHNGYCKFRSTCKFDHPIGSLRYSPSSSSLLDMPIAPSISRKESSGNITSCASAGLILSQTGSFPLSDQANSRSKQGGQVGHPT